MQPGVYDEQAYQQKPEHTYKRTNHYNASRSDVGRWPQENLKSSNSTATSPAVLSYQ